jgi:hypothetical protein
VLRKLVEQGSLWKPFGSLEAERGILSYKELGLYCRLPRVLINCKSKAETLDDVADRLLKKFDHPDTKNQLKDVRGKSNARALSFKNEKVLLEAMHSFEAKRHPEVDPRVATQYKGDQFDHSFTGPVECVLADTKTIPKESSEPIADPVMFTHAKASLRIGSEKLWILMNSLGIQQFKIQGELGRYITRADFNRLEEHIQRTRNLPADQPVAVMAGKKSRARRSSITKSWWSRARDGIRRIFGI